MARELNLNAVNPFQSPTSPYVPLPLNQSASQYSEFNTSQLFNTLVYSQFDTTENDQAAQSHLSWQSFELDEPNSAILPWDLEQADAG